MSKSYPPVTGSDMKKVLNHLGFILKKNKNNKKKGSSHKKFFHPESKKLTILSTHNDKDEIKTGTFNAMLRQMEITKKDFFNILKNL